MASNFKPYTSQSCDITNVPVAQDAADTPVTSPISGGTAETELIVPASAVRIVLYSSGTDDATFKTGTTGGSASGGVMAAPGGVPIPVNIAGMGCDGFPGSIFVTAGASSDLYFYFDCIRPNGDA